MAIPDTVFWDSVIGWRACIASASTFPSEEWKRIAATARQTRPDEKLSNAELLRRCVVLGVRTLQYLSPESARQFVSIYRNYQPPIDGDRRLTIHDEPEPNHPSD